MSLPGNTIALTWGVIKAMERSHLWRIHRNEPKGQCSICGDDVQSPVRYCPGDGHHTEDNGPEYQPTLTDFGRFLRDAGGIE